MAPSAREPVCASTRPCSVPLSAAASSYLTQVLPKTFPNRIAQHLLDRPVRFLARRILSPSRCLAEHHPVGRPITGASPPRRIHDVNCELSYVRCLIYLSIVKRPIDPIPPRRLSQRGS